MISQVSFQVLLGFHIGIADLKPCSVNAVLCEFGEVWTAECRCQIQPQQVFFIYIPCGTEGCAQIVESIVILNEMSLVLLSVFCMVMTSCFLIRNMDTDVAVPHAGFEFKTACQPLDQRITRNIVGNGIRQDMVRSIGVGVFLPHPLDTENDLSFFGHIASGFYPVVKGFQCHIHFRERRIAFRTFQLPVILLVRQVNIQFEISEEEFVLGNDKIVCQVLVPHFIFSSSFGNQLKSRGNSHPETAFVVRIKYPENAELFDQSRIRFYVVAVETRVGSKFVIALNKILV